MPKDVVRPETLFKSAIDRCRECCELARQAKNTDTRKALLKQADEALKNALAVAEKG